MRPINHNLKPYLLALAIVLAVAFLVFLNSCNPSKQISRAKQRVLTDSAAFNEVGHKYIDLNPCSNDSVLITKSDTVTLLDFIEYDKDTIRTKDTVYIINTQVRNITKQIRDTFKITVVDRQKEKIQEKDIVAKDVEIARLRGTIIELRQSDADKGKRGNWLLFWLILAIVAGMASHFIKFKLPWIK